jgi:Ca-activated chloride channel family protein
MIREPRARRPALSALAATAAVVAAVVATDGLHARARQAPLFRTGVDLVNLGVTVTDRKGQLVTGLKAGDFEVYEDGRRQAITYFATGDVVQGQNAEIHLGLLLDVSESMGEDIKFTRTAAIKFLNRLPDALDVTIVDFDTEVRAARYSQNEFARLVERIRLQKASGMTALYDAIGLYLDGAGSQEGRKVMLLYSDGGDTQSSLRFSELIDLLKASDVTVYAIGALEHQSGFGRDRGRAILQSIAATTGGQAFFPTSVKDLDQMYEKVIAEIRAQYTLGYLSTNDKTDGSWRKVEVKSTLKGGRDLVLRARKGYYGAYKKP